MADFFAALRVVLCIALASVHEGARARTSAAQGLLLGMAGLMLVYLGVRATATADDRY
jgi:hypothetical protein